jgi:microcystin-dependent protein
MSTPFLAEIRLMSFNFPPKGWALCNGQFLPINQNQALFSLLGTTYGGNGQTTFALPDLRSCAPMHFGSGFVLGQRGGQEFHTLIQSELPQHNHFVQDTDKPGRASVPTGNFFAANRGGYGDSATTTLAPVTVGNTGGSQPHENRPPYSVISMCIALQGIFPSQN